MVIFGGLEIVAAGYLLNEFNKDKVEERTRRRHKHDQHHDDDRPHSRPPHHNHDSNSLRPPVQSPPRPLSAPPRPDPRLDQWQQPTSYGPPQYSQLPPSSRPGPQWQPMPQPPQQFNNYNPSLPPSTGALQGPNAFYPPLQVSQLPPPGYNQQSLPVPGALQRPGTFNPQQLPQRPGPNLQRPNIFPAPQNQPDIRLNIAPSTTQQAAKPPAQSSLQYVDAKTGKVYHNLYPPDHPMSRNTGVADASSGTSRDVYFGDKDYNRQLPGDINTGLEWSEADEDDLAYGKDYSKPRDRARREISYERRSDRRRRSSPPRYEF